MTSCKAQQQSSTAQHSTVQRSTAPHDEAVVYESYGEQVALKYITKTPPSESLIGDTVQSMVI